MIDKWAEVGHRLGECWVNQQRSITYISIPKNASSFTKACLLSTRDHWMFNESLIDNQKNLVILRDPVDRWCSGIAQSLFNSKKYDWPIEDIFKFISVDDHTESQIYFLNEIDLANTTFILADGSLKETLSKWLTDQGIDNNLQNIDQYNASNTDIRGEIKTKFIKLLAKDPDLVLKLKKHFEADYELINRVKFYGT
jgi:hypothetical protein